MSITNGILPGDASERKAAGGYVPNVGVTAIQLGTPTSDGQSQPSAPQVIAGASGAPFVGKPANTPPTQADVAEVVALSPNNTGLPVNVPSIAQKAVAKSTGSVASLAQAFAS